MALILPNTIENDTPADAAELQQNFSAIQTHVNANLIARDGSVAMTGPLLLPGDPTLDNHAANKEYVDTTTVGIAEAPVAWVPTYSGLVVGNGTIVTSVSLKQGRQCTVSWHFRFGSTSTLSGTLILALPYQALSEAASGTGWASGGGSWPLNVLINDPTTKTQVIVSYYGTGAAWGDPADFRPLGDPGWAAGNEIAFEMTYLTAE